MAYQPNINHRDRGGAMVAVVAIHVALLFALLHLSGKVNLPGSENVMEVFEFSQPPPPAQPPPPPPAKQTKAEEKEGGSAPANLRSEATPVQAPKPKVVVPPVPQITASETPREGTAPTQGASDIAGPGTGSGGSGNGSGSGSGGSGTGGGGADSRVAQPPRLISPVLRGRDFSRDLLGQWPRSATVFLRLKVDARGFVTECTVDRGTQVPQIDSSLCNLAHDRLRFRPALNRSGQAVAGWFGYAQPAPR